MIKYQFLFILLISFSSLFANPSISINASQDVLRETVSRLAIDDVQQLLQETCLCIVDLNNEEASIQLVLQSPSKRTSWSNEKGIRHKKDKNGIPHFYYPSTNFEWSSKAKGDVIFLTLQADSPEGIAAALYALLQEKLGFRFFHPRKMIVPKWKDWPLTSNWNWKGKERFLKRGFHLHTMHPIELTEALLDHNFPNGQQMIFEYIDWLARNGQNYFEFNLLNSIELDEWLPYAKSIVDYAHQRGIIMGIDISLHMIQQKAFMLYRNVPASFKSKRKQVLENLNGLAKVGWDVYNIELSSTEYTSGNAKRRTKLKQLIVDWATEQNVKIMGRAHVVKKGEAVLNYQGEKEVTDAERGVMIHTVMFYEIAEEKAPVYGNENLKHMLSLMDKEQVQRETWYFPESAYWVTFDNSVPMLLLPYLSARLNDILLMEEKGITGHLTFSSGWEWGYWLVDWSIARWSWDYEKEVHPTDALELLFEDKEVVEAFNEVLDLQNNYLKDQELIRYLVAQSVMDEVPKIFSREFHPRPKWRYKDLYRNVDATVLNQLMQEAILPLEELSTASNQVLEKMATYSVSTNHQVPLDELKDALIVTNLRTKHRQQCLMAMYEHRTAKLTKNKSANENNALLKAAAFRQEALAIVKQREAIYAYDLTMLSTQRKGHTAYHFGYLFPVSNLHFWKREEEQIKRNRWGFGLMNIWHIRRIMGLSK